MSQELPRSPDNAQSLGRLRAKASLALDHEERKAGFQRQTRRNLASIAAILAAPFFAEGAPQQHKPTAPVSGGPPPAPTKSEPQPPQKMKSDDGGHASQSKSGKKDATKLSK